MSFPVPRPSVSLPSGAPLNIRGGRAQAQAGGQVGGQVATTRPSLAEITRRHKEHEEENKLPSDCCRLIKDELDHVTSQRDDIHVELGEALSRATTRETENWTLTGRVYELEGQVSKFENEKRVSERQRAVLEEELENCRLIIYQLPPSTSSHALRTSNRVLSINVHNRAPSAGSIEEDGMQNVDTTPPVRLAHPCPAVSLTVPAQVSHSSSRSTLASRSSRTSSSSLAAESDDDLDSVAGPASPGLRAATGYVPPVLSDTLEAARQDRARRERLRNVSYPAASPRSARPPPARSTSGHSTARSTVTRHASSSREIVWDKESLPGSSGNTTAYGEREGAAGGGVGPSNTSYAHVTAGASTGARRPPLGPSNAQPVATAAGGSAQISPELMARIRTLLSKKDIKALKQLLAQRDSCESDSAKRAELVQRVKQLFSDAERPAFSGSSVSTKYRQAFEWGSKLGEVKHVVIDFVKAR